MSLLPLIIQYVCRAFKVSRGAVALLLLTFVVSPGAQAHEYYLLPDAFNIQPGEKVGIAHKNGVRFKGNTFPWISSWNVRSEAWRNGVGGEVRGKDGDLPALTLQMSLPGLISVVHESTWSDLIFTDWAKFTAYLEEEGLSAIAQQHLEQGGEKDRIKEIYARFAKTLVNVEPGAEGKDSVTGLTIELVALENPAGLSSGTALPVQLLFDGKPLPGATVKVFVGQDSDPAHNLVTDEKGMVSVPDGGAGPYLLNAVHMIAPRLEAEIAKDAHWQSFWASLTFAR